MRIRIAAFFLPAAVFCFYGVVKADTIYLKSGRSLEGITAKETGSRVELEVCSGKVVFEASQVAGISRSSQDQRLQIRKRCEADNDITGRSIREYSVKESNIPGSIDLIEQNGHVFADALLNGKVKAKLILDTGATFVVLPYKIARELRIDMNTAPKSIQLQLGDGSYINAALVTIDSIRVGRAQATRVEAAILPGQVGDIEDGILGMSFLRRFSFKVDYSKRKLILEGGGGS